MSESTAHTEALVIPYQGAPRREKPSLWPILLLTVILLAIPYILGYSIRFVVFNYMTEGQTLRAHAIAYNSFVISTPLRLFSFSVMMSLNFIALACFSFRAKTPLRSELGLRHPKSSMISTVVFVLGALGFDSVLSSLQYSLGLQSNSLSRIHDFIRHASTDAPIRAFLIVAVIGPILEEMIFRGYIQTRLVRRLGPMWGILLTSALFGIFHRDLIQGAIATLLGIYQGAIRYRTGSLYPAIACHIAINGASCLIIYWGLGPILIDHRVVLTGWVEVIAACYLLVKMTAPFAEYRALHHA